MSEERATQTEVAGERGAYAGQGGGDGVAALDALRRAGRYLRDVY